MRVTADVGPLSHAFILAEATPTLSLQDKSRHKEELWMGYAKVVGELDRNVFSETPSSTMKRAATMPLLRKVSETLADPYVHHSRIVHIRYASIRLISLQRVQMETLQPARSLSISFRT